MASQEEQSSEDDETQPLMPVANSMTKIDMKESVYSFMLFQPPISRKRAGHYYTPEVMLAFALLTLNLILQMGLTLIAGNRIVQTASDFSKTLVNTNFRTTPWADFLVERQSEADRVLDTNFEYVGGALGMERPPLDPAAAKCCNGAECAELKMRCCNRKGAKPHRPIAPLGINESEIEANDSKAEAPPGLQSNFLSSRKRSTIMPAAKEQHGEEQVEEAEVTSSLCRLEGAYPNQTLTCTPPSFEFLGAWDYLDANGDGMWTLEEARADEANLGCHLGLPVEEVFRSTCRGVHRDSEDTSEHSQYSHIVPSSVQERRAVPKAYFDWWKGLSVICVAHDVSRCGELVARGIFDGAIRSDQRFEKGGVHDLDSALDYCQRLLRPGGICEKTLPGAYMMYRSRVSAKCGKATFSKGPQYTNPFQAKDVLQTVQVGYTQVEQYRTASQFRFKFFLGLILFLWYVNLLGELKSIVDLLDFTFSFPIINQLPLFTTEVRRALSHYTSYEFEDIDKNLDPSGTEITEISRAHQLTCMIMLLTRVFILIYMFHVGSNFLITNHKYDDLLLNAVALAFIFELPEFLYSFLVSDELKAELESVCTAEYESKILPPPHSLNAIFFTKSLWGIIICPIVVLSVIAYNDEVTTLPSFRALQCACFQEGDLCAVSQQFSRDWWNNYWQNINAAFQSG
jgi:hypothetical protein